jgi:hypothetical protein
MARAATPTPFDGLLDVIARRRGFRSLRPLQEPAMRAVLGGRDSLVLPTGGGKSLGCQAPAVFQCGTTVVVSPLISLMKEQVDGLRAFDGDAPRMPPSLGIAWGRSEQFLIRRRASGRLHRRPPPNVDQRDRPASH